MEAGARTTLLLRRVAAGDAEAANDLLPLIYDELHGMARRYMAGERAQHTLQPTALIHEAWMRLMRDQPQTFHDRAHFMAIAARAMRRVLIEAARHRKREKRGGGHRPLPLEAALDAFAEGAPDLLELDEALECLADVDPQLARIVELRFFGGASNPEIAEALGVSTRTVERGWRSAQVWLAAALADGDEA